MTDTPEEIAAELCDPAMAALVITAAANIERQAAEIAAKDAEIGRLQAGGCARDQGLTQYCAEAASAFSVVDMLRAEIERLHDALDKLLAETVDWDLHGNDHHDDDCDVCVAIAAAQDALLSVAPPPPPADTMET